MASLPFYAISPSGILAIIGLLHGPDRTVPTPKEDWRTATIDLLIPTYNEEKNIVLCLASILKQTVKPRRIVLIDDASKDSTIEVAQNYCNMMNINLEIFQHQTNEGKTPSLNMMAHTSDADVMVVLDGDTVLRSNNYLERLVQELYQGVGIACTCGVILPLTDADRRAEFSRDHLSQFAQKYPLTKYFPDITMMHRFQRQLTNTYREELYLFLQRLVYHGEMIFFGTILFPIGCAVAYRRKYLEEIFDCYAGNLGNDLTTSEDIFIGFSFSDKGYRNVVVQDVYAFTVEPRISKLYGQIFKWSSSFLQSCYYFNSLMMSPFKFPKYLKLKYKQKKDVEFQKMIKESRHIIEAYRQPFSREYTATYGRKIGWFVFTSAFEKISYPTIIIILIILRLWIPLAFTIATEVSLYCIIITLMHKNRRIKNLFKALFINAPLRYSQLIFDIYVMGNFVKDLWITKNRSWRK